MNERIRELAEQAGIKLTPCIIDGEEYEYEDVDMDGSEDLEKFAELIIRECCEVLREEVEVALSAVGDVAYPERLVRKHFGVEE